MPRPILWLCLILVLFITTTAQLPTFGSCPYVQTQLNFDVRRYLGKWYEAERYFSALQLGGRCSNTFYSINNNGTILFTNEQFSELAGGKYIITGFATQHDLYDKAKLVMNFPSLLQTSVPYWVIGTDYVTYAVVWSCSDFGLLNIKNLWILTRDQHPPVYVLEKAYRVLDRNDISRRHLTRTNQNNCDEVKFSRWFGQK